jgi:hypothetical protein
MWRYICLTAGILGIVMTALSVKTFFWKSSDFSDAVVNIQMEGKYLPYRARKILWSKEIAIVKVESERMVEYLWIDRWIGSWALFFIYPLILGLKKKYWPEILVALTITCLGVMTQNPNPGYFEVFMIFPLLPIIFCGLKKAKRKYLIIMAIFTVIFWAVK